MAPEVIDLSTSEAKAVLDKEKQVRTQKCSEEMGALLKKYQCSIVTKVTLIGTQIIPEVVIVANDPQTQN